MSPGLMSPGLMPRPGVRRAQGRSALLLHRACRAGVRPAHRGKGIGTLAEACCVSAARAKQGWWPVRVATRRCSRRMSPNWLRGACDTFKFAAAGPWGSVEESDMHRFARSSCRTPGADRMRHRGTTSSVVGLVMAAGLSVFPGAFGDRVRACTCGRLRDNASSPRSWHRWRHDSLRSYGLIRVHQGGLRRPELGLVRRPLRCGLRQPQQLRAAQLHALRGLAP